MAAKINKSELGRNETRLMDFAGTVLQSLKEANFTAIASAILQLLQDQAVAQVVGWHSVESLRQKTELLDLGLSKEQAEELLSMKSSVPKPRQFFRSSRQRRDPNQRNSDFGEASKGGKEKSQGSSPKKKQ